MIDRVKLNAFLSELKFFAIFFVVFMIFRTTAFAMYHIPSESMLPTLAVGDRITVSKFAYGYSKHSVPFSLGPTLKTKDGRLFGKLPQRGDVVVFKHPRTNETYIKRVVGLPGDEVEIRNGRLLINKDAVLRSAQGDIIYKEHRGDTVGVRVFDELFPNGTTHMIYERSDQWHGDNITAVTIPENHLFVLGDNRDNSVDSRYFVRGVGFLPMDHLVGRAERLAFSTYRCHKEPGKKCLTRNWFSKLN